MTADAADPTPELRPCDLVGGGPSSALPEQDLSYVGRSPARAEATVDVDAPPSAVWAVLVDHRRWPEWFGPALVSCEPTSAQEEGVGATRVVRLRGGAAIAERFIAWDEEELWAFTGTAAKPKVFAALVEQARLELLPRDRTRITYTMAFEPNGLLRFGAPLLSRGISLSLKSALKNLARRAEDGAGDATPGPV